VKRLGAFVFAAVLGASAIAHADDASETSKLFADGVKALEDERPNDAVASFEALADRGVVDAVASYDRGLAYALRVRANAEQPGDLGRAAHGFEEARALTNDAKLAADAQSALKMVRGEVSRRKAREGVTVDMEQHASPWRTLTRVLTENTWTWLAVFAAFALGAGLFLRWLATASRARAAAAIVIAVSAPVMILGAALARSARSDRLNLREAIVISPAARPSDAHGIVLPQATPLPEAARVEIVGDNGSWTEFRWGTLDAWVPAQTLRPLAKRE
jgi:hypothetical protein